MSYKIKEYTRVNRQCVDGEYPTMLDAVRGGLIFDVYRLEDGSFCFVECGDDWYCVDVTPEQLRALGQELIDLANHG